MAESKLRTLSIDFAVQILNLVKFLKSQHETIVSNQIGRAGTSIGANIHEVMNTLTKNAHIIIRTLRIFIIITSINKKRRQDFSCRQSLGKIIFQPSLL